MYDNQLKPAGEKCWEIVEKDQKATVRRLVMAFEDYYKALHDSNSHLKSFLDNRRKKKKFAGKRQTWELPQDETNINNATTILVEAWGAFLTEVQRDISLDEVVIESAVASSLMKMLSNVDEMKVVMDIWDVNREEAIKYFCGILVDTVQEFLKKYQRDSVKQLAYARTKVNRMAKTVMSDEEKVEIAGYVKLYNNLRLASSFLVKQIKHMGKVRMKALLKAVEERERNGGEGEGEGGEGDWEGGVVEEM